jgi:hypothetical protein
MKRLLLIVVELLPEVVDPMNERQRLRVWAAVATLLLAVPATAIVYVMPTDESMVDRSPIIVFGEVLSVRPGPGGASPTTEYLFSVEEVLKGFVAGSAVMIRQPGGGGDDGTAMSVMGLPMLAEGNRVLLFLHADENGAHSIVEYGLGMFWEVVAGDRSLLLREPSVRAGEMPRSGVPRAEEPAMERQPRNAASFRRWIADRAAGVMRRADYFETRIPPADLPVGVASPYRLFRCQDGFPLRWQEFDRNDSVGFIVHSGGQPGVPGGGLRQVRARTGSPPAGDGVP